MECSTGPQNIFQRGIYSDVTVTASDGRASASRTFTINVAKTNQTPIFIPTANQIGPREFASQIQLGRLRHLMVMR